MRPPSPAPTSHTRLAVISASGGLPGHPGPFLAERAAGALETGLEAEMAAELRASIPSERDNNKRKEERGKEKERQLERLGGNEYMYM